MIVIDGRITWVGPAALMKIPPGGTVEDFTGRNVIPGMINLHGHVSIASGLAQDANVYYTRDRVAKNLALSARYGCNHSGGASAWIESIGAHLQDAKQLAAAGIDGFVHSVRDGPVDDELIRLMKQHGTWQMAATMSREASMFAYTKPSRALDGSFFAEFMWPD
jgi:predicted amidohydrolase YtcJ